MPNVRTINPFTGDTIREWEQQDFSGLTSATTRAQEVFCAWRKVPLTKRVNLVRDVLNYFEENQK